MAEEQRGTRRKISARIAAAVRAYCQARHDDRATRELIRQQRRAAAIAASAAADTTPTRRRLPRGWWPDQSKREGLKLKAMDDLKNETFVSPT